MKRPSLILCSISTALFAASCANYITLDDPQLFAEVKDDALSELASVKFTNRRLRDEILVLKKVDGALIERFKIAQGLYQVSPGRRELVIQYSANNSVARVKIEADLMPGRRYIPRVDLVRNTASIWLVDFQSGERVSNVSTKAVERLPIMIDTGPQQQNNL